MRPIFKIILLLVVFFASTFIVAKLTGVLSLEIITTLLERASEINPIYLVLIIVLLLFSDLFIAVPTLSITLLSGYFLGLSLGSIASISGMLLAGLAGYGLSIRYGDRLLKFVIRSEQKRNEAIADFEKYGFAMVLLSRVSPILPEVSACMSGISRMKFSKFLTAWCLNTIPYGLIAVYSGSISSLENPRPAIYSAIGIYAFLWLGWVLFKKYK